MLAAEPIRLRASGNLGADADDNPRHVLVMCGGVNHPPFFRTVVHERPDTPENRMKDREPDGMVAFSRRHEHGFVRHGPGAMESVIVAIAEKDEVIELG